MKNRPIIIALALLTSACSEQQTPTPVEPPPAPAMLEIPTPAPAKPVAWKPDASIKADLDDPRVVAALKDVKKMADVSVQAFYIARERLMRDLDPAYVSPSSYEDFASRHTARITEATRSLGQVAAEYRSTVLIEHPSGYFEVKYFFNGLEWSTLDLKELVNGEERNYYGGGFLGKRPLKPYFDQAVTELLRAKGQTVTRGDPTQLRK